MKRIISILLKIVVTVGLFVLLFWPETFGLPPDTFGGVKPMALLNEISSLNPSHAIPWLLFALFIRLGGIMCGVVRWKILLNGQNLYMPFGYMTQSWFIGRTIGIFLPSTIGLDGYRLYDSVLYTRDVVRSTTVIFIEKIIGFISLTTLVFLTFPLGFRILKFNTLILLIILFILGLAVLFFLSLLLQPYIIQLILYSIPTPNKVKKILNQLGEAATAYAGHRKYLLLAIILGICVHLSACLMYFGTMMALRSENTSIWDILFASPLMIYGTVLGPSVGGEGIREVVFATLLGGKEDTLKVVAFAHLGWWVGDVVPFLIGLPFLIFRKRPQKEEIQKKMEEFRSQQPSTEVTASKSYINQAEFLSLRNKILTNLLFATIGGITAGTICGLSESLWILYKIPNLHEFQMLWWGPITYGILSAGMGICIGIFAATWLPLLVRKLPSSLISYVVSFALTLMSVGLILLLWRYWRDVLLQKPSSYFAYLPITLYYIGFICIASTLLYILLFYLNKFSKYLFIGIITFLLVIPTLFGFGYSFIFNPQSEKLSITSLPEAQPDSPNIILIIADALRADYLSAYNPDIETKTPVLDRFVEKSILFEDCSSQASWTKPSFASLYTGVIPLHHQANAKNAVINSNLTTVAEVLTNHGYLTKGFGNNPNVHSLFGFGRGFLEYTDLQSDYVLFAKESSSKLTAYEILRRVYGKFSSIILKILHKPPNIREYYQPAEVVTTEALKWIDNRPEIKHPFFLAIHYMDPHDPYLNLNDNTFFARALLGNNPKSQLTPSMRKAYISEIEYLDKYLGILFNELDKRGLNKDTYIIFTADHGEEFEDHNGWWHGFTLYQEMLHVPLIIKVPDSKANSENMNKRTNFLLRLIDVSATIPNLAGIKPPETFEGIPLLSEEGKVIIPENTIYAWAENDAEGQVMQSIRDKTHKLILTNTDNPRRLEAEELYDLSKDAKEKNNLSNSPDFSSIKQNLHQKMIELKENSKKSESNKSSEQVPLPPELIEQLKATGYME